MNDYMISDVTTLSLLITQYIQKNFKEPLFQLSGLHTFYVEENNQLNLNFTISLKDKELVYEGYTNDNWLNYKGINNFNIIGTKAKGNLRNSSLLLKEMTYSGILLIGDICLV